jgi:nitrogen fixation protein NifX
MSFKVAVASSDGKVINRHFGRCDNFGIFNINNKNEYSFLENRKTDLLCGVGGHEDSSLDKIAVVLSDCKYVLVSQIGPSAEQILKINGIRALSINDYIEIALNKIIKFEQKKNKKDKE